MRIPLFDEILQKSGFTDTETFPNYYDCMFRKLLNLKGTKKEFYKDLIENTTPCQRRKLSDILIEDKQILMWIQFLSSISRKKLNGVPVILEMKKFSCEVKDIGILHLAKKYEKELPYFATLQPPLTLSEVDSLITKEISYFKGLIKNMVSQKLLFLTYSNTIDLNEEVSTILCYFISRMHAFIPLYRGVELRKLLNRSIKNEILNQINFYTAKKRRNMETDENTGICFSKVISQNCKNSDGEGYDLLDHYIGEQNEFGLPILQIECSNQIRHYKNDKIMVEILKILSNDSPSYINWYNARFGTQYEYPVQASEDKNFLNSVADFCKISFTSLKGFLERLKPNFQDILSCVG